MLVGMCIVDERTDGWRSGNRTGVSTLGIYSLIQLWNYCQYSTVECGKAATGILLTTTSPWKRFANPLLNWL